METKSSDILLSLNHHNLEVWKVGDTVCVKYVDSYISDPPCLIGAFGRGGTFEGACHDYLSQIRGKTLVFNAYDDNKRKKKMMSKKEKIKTLELENELLRNKVAQLQTLFRRSIDYD